MEVQPAEPPAPQVPNAIPARLHHHLLPLRWGGASEVHIPLRALCRAAGMSLAPPAKEAFSTSMPLSARSSAGRQSHERGGWHTQAKSLQDWHLQSRDRINGGILFHGDGGRWNAAQLTMTQGAFDAAVAKLHALLEEPNARLQEALKAEPGETVAGETEQVQEGAPKPWSSEIVGDDVEKQLAVIMAERLYWTKVLVWSLVIWRRFGTVAFAQTAGWMYPRKPAMEQKAALDDLVEEAVCLWRTGYNAALGGVEPAWHTFEAERKAWQLGGSNEQQEYLKELETVRVPTYPQGGSKRSEQLRDLRTAMVTPAGEQAVRKAYRTLLYGPKQEVWDLYRSLDSVAKAALEGNFLSLIDRLAQVKGFEQSAGFLAREVALDLKTMTPLADDAGPNTWSIDYVTWLRKRMRINPVSKAKVLSQKTETVTTTTIKTETVTTEKKKMKKVVKCSTKATANK